MGPSVLILTLNEEVNLPRCLASLPWCDDIVILDSYSTDQTENIVAEAGARFIRRRFDDYATHRMYGLTAIEYKHPWVLMVDADEVVPPELAAELQKAIAKSDDTTCLFRMRRKDYFLGKWIKRSSGYPTWFGRLVRVGRVRVEREINEEYHTAGNVGLLDNHLLHFPFNKGFSAWLDKHNRYSTMEAQAMSKRQRWRLRFSDFFNRDPARRRMAAKALLYALPARPLLVFIALYFVRGGILEGAAGFTFSVLKAMYEYMIDCKVKEFKRRGHGLPL